ncbi:MAG: flotillin-like FloA family protein, partial [Planctomycetota bacterium]
MSSPFVWVPLIIAGVVALFIGFFIFQFLNLWVQAFLSGARVSLFSLIGMKLRKVRPDIIVLSRIKSV